jgi:hypothetical protein
MTQALLIFYTFAFAAFEYFPEDFFMTDISIGRHKENVCMELKQCFFTHLSFV